MKILFFCLLLPSLTLAQGSTQIVAEIIKFEKMYTYRGDEYLNCDIIGSVLQPDRNGKEQCKTCNPLILGDKAYSADYNEINSICKRGTPLGGNLYRSHRKFRVIYCKVKRYPSTGPKNPEYCNFLRLYDSEIQNKYITVTCKRGYVVGLQEDC